MNLEDARRWHQQLYAEIRLEKTAVIDQAMPASTETMRIGITYDLRDQYLAEGYGEEETAEFDRADTIDAIDDALRESGPPDRPHRQRPRAGPAAGTWRWLGLGLQHLRRTARRGREGQVPAILDVYDIPYTFADPCVMSVCLDKGVTKSVVRDAGLAHAPVCCNR